MGESSLMLWSPMPGTFDRRRRDSVTAPVGTSDFLHGKEERKKTKEATSALGSATPPPPTLAAAAAPSEGCRRQHHDEGRPGPTGKKAGPPRRLRPA